MSIKVNVYNQKGEKVGDVSLAKNIFGVTGKPELVHQAVVTQTANERQVLAHTKQRAEVRGGGKKPWKQKGTGRARAGTIRSPLWTGGGITFGPTSLRSFGKKINKKMKRKAIFMVLSDKLSNQNLIILDNFDIEDYKTKLVDQILKNLETKVFTDKDIKKTDKSVKKRSSLIVSAEGEEKLKKSGRNLEGVKIINSDNINILDLLKYRNAIFTKKTIEKLEARYKISK